jgi:hypothetical protein
MAFTTADLMQQWEYAKSRGATPGRTLTELASGLTRRPGEEEQRRGMFDQAGAAGRFAGVGEAGFGRMQGNLDASADWLQKVASGQESISKLQLADAAERNIGHQRSMAAGAAPRDAAMAMFGASRNAGDIASGLAGQQAIAGLQERQDAQRALADLQLGRSGQYLQAGLGSRQNALGGLGNIQPGQSWLDQLGGAIGAGAQLYTIGGGGGPRGGSKK